MDFGLTVDQVLLKDGIRAFLEGRFATDVVRSIEISGRIDRTRWRELAETGAFSLMVPASEGGLGMGICEAALVFEELGRALVPGPLVGTVLATSHIPEASTGELIVGLLEPSDLVTLVEHPDDLGALVLLAADGIRRLDPASVAITKVETPLDALTPVGVVRGAVPAGDLLAGPDSARIARSRGTVLTAALQLGIALRTVELATEHSRNREQFGRAIGSFQAVKHMCADMLVKAEVARAAVYAAAVALDGRSDEDPFRAASIAKCLAGDVAIQNSKTAIQVHGGVGYTWEGDVQRFWKRACVLDTHFGDSDVHAELVAATI